VSVLWGVYPTGVCMIRGSMRRRSTASWSTPRRLFPLPANRSQDRIRVARNRAAGFPLEGTSAGRTFNRLIANCIRICWAWRRTESMRDDRIGSGSDPFNINVRRLAIPQLLLSSACAILPTVKADRTAVFPHRRLAPLQVTRMSGAHQTLYRMTAPQRLLGVREPRRGRHR